MGVHFLLPFAEEMVLTHLYAFSTVIGFYLSTSVSFLFFFMIVLC